jgi:hypothetical protein
MPDFRTIETLKNVDLLMTLVRSLSQAHDDLAKRVTQLETRLNNRLTLNGNRQRQTASGD